jgi:endonuclease YncB( thermonuclease family)
MTLRQAVMISIAWLIFSPAHAADFTGVPRIVDGDTLAIGSTKVRLEGIDAPETDQVCLNAKRVRWAWHERVVYENGRVKRFETESEAWEFLARCDLAGKIIH